VIPGPQHTAVDLDRKSAPPTVGEFHQVLEKRTLPGGADQASILLVQRHPAVQVLEMNT
jgi:hypothetical protein